MLYEYNRVYLQSWKKQYIHFVNPRDPPTMGSYPSHDIVFYFICRRDMRGEMRSISPASSAAVDRYSSRHGVNFQYNIFRGTSQRFSENEKRALATVIRRNYLRHRIFDVGKKKMIG